MIGSVLLLQASLLVAARAMGAPFVSSLPSAVADISCLAGLFGFSTLVVNAMSRARCRLSERRRSRF